MRLSFFLIIFCSCHSFSDVCPRQTSVCFLITSVFQNVSWQNSHTHNCLHLFSLRASLSLPFSFHPAPTCSLIAGRVDAQISLAMPCRLWSPPAVMDSRPRSALLIPTLCHPAPSHPPFNISRPPSALSALVVYNMAISCLWQMKDRLHTTNLSLESRAVEV